MGPIIEADEIESRRKPPQARNPESPDDRRPRDRFSRDRFSRPSVALDQALILCCWIGENRLWTLLDTPLTFRHSNPVLRSTYLQSPTLWKRLNLLCREPLLRRRPRWARVL